MSRLAILVTLTILVIGRAPAQEPFAYSERAEKSFSEALASFEAGEYRRAAEGFDGVTREPRSNHRTTAAHVMKAKALLHLRDYPEAVRVLRSFLARFPGSSYVADAHYTLALTQLSIHRYDDAAVSLLSAMNAAEGERGNAHVASLAVKALDATLGEYVSRKTVERLITESPSARERSFLWLTIAEDDIRQGSVRSAARALDSASSLGTDPLFSGRIQSLRQQLTAERTVKLGALIPLMRNGDASMLKEIGEEIHNGILMAMEEMDPNGRIKIRLEVKDTERDPLLAIRGTQELTSDDDVVAIIGPVFSSTASAAVGLANARGIPMITPTANANGIAAVGPFVFQANPDYQTRGKAMAQFAMLKKGLKTFAVMAPIDTYAKFLAEGFIAEVQRLGGKIVATEWYQKGTADLKIQLSNIRRVGMLEAADPFLTFGGKISQLDIARLVQLGVPLRVIDSLIEKSSIVSASVLLGPDARVKIDSLGISALYTDPKTDSLEYPVTGLDGFYIPISAPEEIGVVSSQLVYYNFKTQLLGSGEWNNFAELDANKRYCSGVIFESDNNPVPDNPAYTSLVDRYIDRFRKRPGKNVLYGYDTARLIISLIQNGASSRELLSRTLAETQDYPGLHSKIGFSAGRVNTWVMILQYTPDRIERIDEMNVE